MKPLKIIISGGGTGGHIYPAIAIANRLKEKNPLADILFVGADGKMEMEKVPQAGYSIEALPIRGIQRKLTLENLSFPIRLARSIFKARKIIKAFQPQVCVGVGGYASGPLLYAASLSGIPTLIQEQNSYAGLTNKWLSQKAAKICVAYPDMEQFFPAEKIVLTGNPVRKDIADAFSKKTQALAHFGLKADKKTLLVMGGSLGARTINESILAGLEKLVAADVQVLWQTGKFYFEKIKADFQFPTEKIKIYDFIREMDLAYALADVVLSRAGALSISEICLVGKPAIFVPSPNVAEDHQTKNAMALVAQHAALLITDAEAKEKLVFQALQLLADEKQQQALSQNILKLAQPDAAEKIVEEILKLTVSKRF
ncbi:MAG: undecaprenyldiphospho-muramoylpentapeptide beta-N-acetylglucosaminyltransferase [Verrucomicrobia bacterium]|nr:undecaprenyldiphospho-muramoylpentapeptide beta-N-acetylglucosaminyltransferase [Cytophagales bacterium]